MIAYTDYAGDARVRREAETLAAKGFNVVCLTNKNGGKPTRYTLDGVEVRELRVSKYRGKSTVAYLLSYLRFLLAASTSCLGLLVKRQARCRSCPQPAGLPGLCGTRAATGGPQSRARHSRLGARDLCGEVFQGSSRSPDALSRRAAERRGRAQSHLRQSSAAPTLVARGIPDSKTFVSMNVPDPRIFGSPFSEWARARSGAAEPRVSRHDGRAARRRPADQGGGAVARSRPHGATAFVGSWRRPGRLSAPGPATRRGREHRIQCQGVSLERPSTPTELDGCGSRGKSTKRGVRSDAAGQTARVRLPRYSGGGAEAENDRALLLRADGGVLRTGECPIAERRHFPHALRSGANGARRPLGREPSSPTTDGNDRARSW